MNAVRLAALGAALTLGLSTAVVAQPPARGARPNAAASDTTRRGARHLRAARAQRGERDPARAMLQNVNLTQTQREQVQAIAKRYADQRRSLMQGAPKTGRDSTARTQLRTQARELLQRQLTEIRGVLSADQQRTFDANVAKFRDRAPRRG